MGQNHSGLGIVGNFAAHPLLQPMGSCEQGAEEFISDEGYTFPVLYDLDYNAATVYGVYSLPTTYFIDSEGYVIAQAKGALSAETLEQGIDMIKDD